MAHLQAVILGAIGGPEDYVPDGVGEAYYLGPLLTFEQAEAWALNFQDDLDRYGFGFWALEVRASGDFIGFTGLGTVDADMPSAGTCAPRR